MTQSLIEKLEAAKNPLEELEYIHPDGLTGNSATNFNAGISKSIEIIRQHEAEAQQPSEDVVERAYGIYTRVLMEETRGDTREALKAVIAAMNMEGASESSVGNHATKAHPQDHALTPSTNDTLIEKIKTYKPEFEGCSEEYEKGFYAGLVSQSCRDKEEDICILRELLRKHEDTAHLPSKISVPEEEGMVWACEKMRELFPSQNSGFTQEATWHVLQAYLDHLPKREYRPHPDTSLTIRIKNAIHELNLKRPDIAALPDGSTISRNIATDRNIGALLDDILALSSHANNEIEDGGSNEK